MRPRSIIDLDHNLDLFTENLWLVVKLIKHLVLSLGSDTLGTFEIEFGVTVPKVHT